MEIGNGSFSGINLYVMAENKQNLNHVEVLSQGIMNCRMQTYSWPYTIAIYVPTLHKIE